MLGVDRFVIARISSSVTSGRSSSGSRTTVRHSAASATETSSSDAP
jgi:hypothetical protein